MKNRDTSDTMNRPVYHPATADKYAYVGVNTYWMGINEKGLAVMNTYMPALGGTGHGHKWGNGDINRITMEICETVEQVAFMLNDTDGIIGPNNRACATCIGVIDRFGGGGFFEVSPTEAYVQYVDGYDSRANHPRHFPGKASGPSGRDQYALDILDRIYAEKGVISWEDVAQGVSRYVRDKEKGAICFSISGEMCNPSTQAAMVAVSGDARYDGKLNCMWGEYGNPPMVGLFVPSIAYAGEPPSILDDFWNEAWEKRSYAHGSCGSYYDPERVRQIQSYTFFAEDYTFDRYDDLLASIPDGLSDAELKTCLQEYVNGSVQVATSIYIEETYYIMRTRILCHGAILYHNITLILTEKPI